MRRHFVEAELLVIVWADPLARIERAFFQRWIDIAAGDLLRNATQFLQNATGETTDTHFQALQISGRVDFLAVPTAHLATRVSCEKCNAIVLLVELVQHFLAAAKRKPTLVQPLVRPECDGRAEGKGGIF